MGAQSVGKKLNVLIVEDDENEAILLSESIKNGKYDVEWERVYTKKELLKKLNNDKWDIIFIDYEIPGFSGIEAIKIIRKKNISLPCIMNSGKRGEEVAVEAMKAGADDYFVKGNYNRLMPAIERELENYKIKKEIEKVELEREQAENDLRLSEEKYRGIFENVQDIYFEVNIAGIVLEISPSIEIVSKGQYHREDVIGLSIASFYSDPGNRESFLSELKKNKSVADFEVTLINKDGSLIPCSITAKIMFDDKGEPIKIIGSMRDISERKRTKQYQNLSAEILTILNDPNSFPVMMNNILSAIKRDTGIDAVGIRLKKENDYPYFVQKGFTDDFLLTENTLTLRDKDGGICLDENGNYSLECTCGLVISGKIDPKNSLLLPVEVFGQIIHCRF